MDGYKIIDFKHANIVNDDPETVPGIYAAIDESNKPLLITNMVISDVLLKPFYTNVVFKRDTTTYSFGIITPDGLIYVTISSDDKVSIAS